MGERPVVVSPIGGGEQDSGPQAVPMVCEFLEVFIEDLPGMPSDREIEFQIDLMLGYHAYIKGTSLHGTY